MADLTYKPVPHDLAKFLAAANRCVGFSEAYDSLALEYASVRKMLKASTKADS